MRPNQQLSEFEHESPMCFRIIFLGCIVSFFFDDYAYSQVTQSKPDSTLLYKNIETFSKRGKFTEIVYRLIFRPVAPNPSLKKKTKKKIYKKLIVKNYSAFEGKTIRRIRIVTISPFGYSISDTAIIPKNVILKNADLLHINSLVITIRDLLLIHQNQPFDSLLVKESERLIRTMTYVHDVSFMVKETSKLSDSVDIFIRELDNWSLGLNVSGSSSDININIKDQNFAGTGQVFQNTFNRDFTKGMTAYIANYSIPNFHNSFISTTLFYGMDLYGNFVRSLDIERPFFSPFAKWAAGVLLSQQFKKDSISYRGFGYQPVIYKYNTQDYWAGQAIRIFKGNTENNRTTNFIIALRFLRIRYLEKPNDMLDSLHIYANENFYLSSFGITTRKYVQDKYIFNYGIVENVPIGNVYNVTIGYQTENSINRIYVGARFAAGNYFSWGYLSSDVEYGTFFHGNHTQQGAILVNLNYFTGLIEVGTWKFRQFIKPQVLIGLQRFAYDSLTLNTTIGLNGFNSVGIIGTSRILCTLQTQSYAPWDFLGFRYGPFFDWSLGMLRNDANGFRHSKVYSQLGLGVLIKNVNLIFNTFQISISFYPYIPGKGLDVIKMNTFKTTDFGFQDFVIGKPANITFQ